MSGYFMVFCDINDPVSQGVKELVTAAHNMAENKKVAALLVTENDDRAEEIAEVLSSYGCNELVVLIIKSDLYSSGKTAASVADYIKGDLPDVFLFSATPENRIIAPQIAALLKSGLTADLCELFVNQDDGLMHQVRPAFGGSLTAEIVCRNSSMQMATVHRGVFQAVEICEKKQIPLKSSFVKLETDEDIRLIEKTITEMSKTVADGEMIFCGGTGLGKEGFDKLNLLCEKYGAVLGATRVAVNEGFAPYKAQIGQTGVTVRPKLYIGFGVSGAVQHTAGMRNSNVIIGVNTDKKAPIRDYCDVFINMDALDFIDMLL